MPKTSAKQPLATVTADAALPAKASKKPIDLSALSIPALNEFDWQPGRVQIGLDILTQCVGAEWITELLADLPEPLDGELNTDYLMSADVDTHGQIKRCWSVEICVRDERPVLRLGDNYFAIVQSGFDISFGNFKGRLSSETLETADKVEYTKVTAHVNSTTTRRLWKFYVALERDLKDEYGDPIEDVGGALMTELNLDSEADITPFLAPPKEPPIQMGLLGVGEFLLLSVSNATPRNSGKTSWNSYTLTVEDQDGNRQSVFSEISGGATDQLDVYTNAGTPINLSAPWTLVISHIEEQPRTKKDEQGNDVTVTYLRATNSLKRRRPHWFSEDSEEEE